VLFLSITGKKILAVCSSPCKNGGKCKGHNFCQCPKGYKALKKYSTVVI
jgi:hypothetical protein